MNKTLINGDCLEHLPNIPDQSVDLILTSPPYNMNLRIRNGKRVSRQVYTAKDLEFTTKYKKFSDNKPMDEYYEFNKKVLEECLRISKLTFFNVQFLTGNKPALFKLIGDFSENMKEMIIWDKITAEPAIGERVMNSRFEVLLVLESDPVKAMARQFDAGQFDRGTLQNLWEIKKERSDMPDNRAVFPSELAEKVISNFTKEEDTVLDMFMGTGRTGVACMKLNRKFIGIEIDKNCFDFSKLAICSVPVQYKQDMLNL